MFYVDIFLLILSWLIIGVNKKITEKQYEIVPLIIMAVIIGLRYETGRDIDNYALMFERAVQRQTQWYYGIERSYIIFSQLFDFLHLSFQALVLSYSIASFIFIYKGLCRLNITKSEYAIFICIFYALGFSTFFILMRQFLSASIIFYTFVKENTTQKQKSINFLMLIVAGLIHRGAFIIIPLFFIFKSSVFKNNLAKLVSLGIAVFIGITPAVIWIIKAIVEFLPQYAYYLEKENFGVASVSRIIVLLTLIYAGILFLQFKYKSNSLSFEIISRGICFALILYYATLRLGWFHRSYWYLTIFIYFVPSYFLRYFNYKRAAAFSAVLFFSIYSIFIFSRIGILEPMMIPYKFSIMLFS